MDISWRTGNFHALRLFAPSWILSFQRLDVLEHMSFADGEAYNNRLIPISRGDVLPDRTKPEEFILYDL